MHTHTHTMRAAKATRTLRSKAPVHTGHWRLNFGPGTTCGQKWPGAFLLCRVGRRGDWETGDRRANTPAGQCRPGRPSLSACGMAEPQACTHIHTHTHPHPHTHTHIHTHARLNKTRTAYTVGLPSCIPSSGPQRLRTASSSSESTSTDPESLQKEACVQQAFAGLEIPPRQPLWADSYHPPTKTPNPNYKEPPPPDSARPLVL